MEIGLGSSNKSVSNIYYLANTPMYLYTMMRQDSFVVLLSEKETHVLIEEFKTMASMEMTKQDEVASLYAILISLTFKPKDEVGWFMEWVKENIKYEWFGKIAEIYQTKNSTKTIFSHFNPPVAISNLTL